MAADENPERGEPQEQKRILVVDDEDVVQRFLRLVLTKAGYEVVWAASGEQALNRAAASRPDLIVLDLVLPDTNGLEVCGQLRKWFKGPILVLSGVGDDASKVEALDIGADDYITKPFSAPELLARIRALFRRVGITASEPVISVGDLEIDLARHLVLRGGNEVRLTRKEFELLAFLVRNVGCVVTTRTLLNQVWEREFGGADTLRVHIRHLRKKLEPNPGSPRYILTEPGIGYRLVAG